MLPEIPEKRFGDFIGGYFDGDGTVGVYDGRMIVRMGSNSQEFLRDLQSKLKGRGIITSMNQIERESGKIHYRLNILKGGHMEFFKLIYPPNRKIKLDRKYEIFKEFFETKEQ